MEIKQDPVYRLRKRAEIRRGITSRKSVKEGKPDRIADILEEAADRILELEKESDMWKLEAECWKARY